MSNPTGEWEANKFKAIVNSAHSAVISTSPLGKVITWNPAAEKYFGYSADNAVGGNLIDLIFQSGGYGSPTAMGDIPDGISVFTLKDNKGEVFSAPVSATSIEEAGLTLSRCVVVNTSALERHSSQLIRQYEALVQSSDDAIICKLLDGTVTNWNPAAERIFGYTEEEMIGSKMLKVFPEDKFEEETMILGLISRGEHIDHFQTVRRHKDGREIHVSVSISPIKNSFGEVIGAAKIARDVTDRVETQETIWKQANFDSLTGLNNRLSFERYVNAVLSERNGSDRRFCLMFIDLDNFKIYNDTYGHSFGDSVLIQVAEMFRKVLRNTDEISRFGGDEFTVCLHDCTTVSVAETIAKKIIYGISEIKKVNGIAVALTASIGVSFYPDDGRDLISLQKKADKAMYEAKQKGKNQFRIYSEANDKENTENYAMVEELSLAVERNQLTIQLQPIYSRESYRLMKAEALVRWTHPEFGQVPPDKFIPLAEKYGLMQGIGNWVLKESAGLLPGWLARYGSQFQLSVNKSPFEFYDHDECISLMEGLLKANGLNGDNLVIEITEHSLLEHTNVTERILKSYTALGVNIAIDDFGTGYSSLSYLKRYDVDILKIDRLFVAEMTASSIEYQLCKGIVNLARSIGVKVVAEGVETDEQLALLLSMGCEFYQGYFFSKPVSVEEFGNLPLTYLDMSASESASHSAII